MLHGEKIVNCDEEMSKGQIMDSQENRIIVYEHICLLRTDMSEQLINETKMRIIGDEQFCSVHNVSMHTMHASMLWNKECMIELSSVLFLFSRVTKALNAGATNHTKQVVIYKFGEKRLLVVFFFFV